MTQRKYYKLEGPKTTETIEKIQSRLDKHNQARRELRDKYDCALFMRGGNITGFGFESPEPRKGFILDEYPTDGYYFAKPDKRTKIGKEADKERKGFNAYHGFSSVSEMVVSAFNADRMVPQRDGGSRTGMSLAISVGGVIKEGDKEFVVLSVPVDEKDPFNTPEEGVEIPKSEFIRITEERGND